MANPNLINVSTVLGSTVGKTINNYTDSDITVLSGITDKVLKLNIIRVTNVHQSIADAITIEFVHDSSGTDIVTSFAQDINIPIRQSLPVLEGSIYLTEDDRLVMRRTNTQLISSDSDTLQALLSYEQLDAA
jgi:hypothetical protein